MKIDWSRIRHIESTFDTVDPLEAYYKKKEIRYTTIDTYVPDRLALLIKAFKNAHKVLDIGCGDGETLRIGSEFFVEGTGIDENDYILEYAKKETAKQKITNLKFIKTAVVNLPFENGYFDMVFSERGPLGHSDITLQSALKVLQSGGYIFYETLPFISPKHNILFCLDEERKRLERFNVEITILCVRIQQQIYEDIYEWAKMKCSTARYFNNKAPFDVVTKKKVEEKADSIDPENGKIIDLYHTLWAGGIKK